MWPFNRPLGRADWAFIPGWRQRPECFNGRASSLGLANRPAIHFSNPIIIIIIIYFFKSPYSPTPYFSLHPSPMDLPNPFTSFLLSLEDLTVSSSFCSSPPSSSPLLLFPYFFSSPSPLPPFGSSPSHLLPNRLFSCSSSFIFFFFPFSSFFLLLFLSSI